jgi:hypothetical protein
VHRSGRYVRDIEMTISPTEALGEAEPLGEDAIGAPRDEFTFLA